MLFSSQPVADHVNAAFEPAWESVRPAPLVTIDFGNGRVVRRTLRGNVTTSVCTPAGDLVDVLPGIYTPAEYPEQLTKLAAETRRMTPIKPARFAAVVNEYHQTRLAVLNRNAAVNPAVQRAAGFGGGLKGAMGGFGGGINGGFGGGIQAVPPANIAGNIGGFGGGIAGGPATMPGIEGPTEAVVRGADPRTVRAEPVDAANLASDYRLQLDAQANELVRRRQVHERLQHAGRVRPADVRKWVFKDVLFTDLDDPLLGLGDLLTRGYPFAAEDAAPPK